MDCYLLDIDSSGTAQTETDLCYIGGLPKLPSNQSIPTCNLCGAEQTFFFYVTFPSKHPWSGLSLAVFACTSCEKEGYLIPKMPDLPLRGVNIHEGFLDTYQVNFRFLVFDSASARMRRDYIERVKFKRWIMKPACNTLSLRNKIGGRPNWILDDESPATYKSFVPMVFLLQIEKNFVFETVSGAPPQMVIDYYGPEGSLRPSPEPGHKLFLGNALYLFGTQAPNERLVYAIVQSD